MMHAPRLFCLVVISAFALYGCNCSCSKKDSTPSSPAAAPVKRPSSAPVKKSTAKTSTTAAIPTAPLTTGVHGVVRFTGSPPAETKINMGSQPDCMKVATNTMTNEYRIKGGKIQDVFVYVKNPPKKKYPVPNTPVVLNQEGCRYIPKVFGVMAKQKVQIINSDPMMHNIHPTGKNSFNLAMPSQGMKIEKTFKKEQVLTSIKCDVHPWMKAYAGVLKHPFFAITDKNGAFSIQGLPAESYTLVAVHGALGTQTINITLDANRASIANFEFSPS